MSWTLPEYKMKILIQLYWNLFNVFILLLISFWQSVWSLQIFMIFKCSFILNVLKALKKKASSQRCKVQFKFIGLSFLDILSISFKGKTSNSLHKKPTKTARNLAANISATYVLWNSDGPRGNWNLLENRVHMVPSVHVTCHVTAVMGLSMAA